MTTIKTTKYYLNVLFAGSLISGTHKIEIEPSEFGVAYPEKHLTQLTGPWYAYYYSTQDVITEADGTEFRAPVKREGTTYWPDVVSLTHRDHLAGIARQNMENFKPGECDYMVKARHGYMNYYFMRGDVLVDTCDECVTVSDPYTGVCNDTN